MPKPAIFSKDALDRIIKETLPLDAKPNEKAVIGTVDQNGAQVVASFKYLSGWELQAAARHEWGGGDSLGGKVLLRW